MAGAAAPAWAVSVEGLSRGDPWLVAFGIGLVILFVAVITRHHVYFDRQWLERRGILTRRCVMWSEVTGLSVMAGGVILWVGRKRLEIWNQLLEGYPELAAEILERVPRQLLDASGGRALLESQAAARLEQSD